MAKSSGQSSTMVRRQLGRRLRALRLAADKTQEDVAGTKLMSLAKLKTIESGRTMVRPGDVYELGLLYDADPEEIAELRALATATTQDGWWQEFGDGRRGLARGFETYLDLESSASRLSIYQPTIVHGLAQTEAYAMEIERGTALMTSTPEMVRASVQLRLQRLPNLLRRDEPPQIDIVLAETALLLQVGDDEVMSAQREHLRELSRLPNMTIKILTHGSGPHRGTIGPFTVLDFPQPEDPPVAYIDSYIGARFDDRDQAVAPHRSIFVELFQKATPVEEHLP